MNNVLHCSEIMLCDFTAGFLNIVTSRNPPAPPPNVPDDYLTLPYISKLPIVDRGIDQNLSVRSIKAGSLENCFPGESHIEIKYSKFISFTIWLFPSVQKSRIRQERWGKKRTNSF